MIISLRTDAFTAIESNIQPRHCREITVVRDGYDRASYFCKCCSSQATDSRRGDLRLVEQREYRFCSKRRHKATLRFVAPLSVFIDVSGAGSEERPSPSSAVHRVQARVIELFLHFALPIDEFAHSSSSIGSANFADLFELFQRFTVPEAPSSTICCTVSDSLSFGSCSSRRRNIRSKNDPRH